MLTIIVNGPHKFCQYSARSAFDEGKKDILHPTKPMELMRQVLEIFQGPAISFSCVVNGIMLNVLTH
jgi:hypothetical protein